MNYFEVGYEEMHNEVEQLIRQERATEEEINWLPVFDENGEQLFNKSGEPRRQYLFNGRLKTCRIKEYLVTLESCTCEDFHRRGKPCKHMYKLASRLGLFVRKDERSRELIADFASGYASSWRFAVRPCNYDALDIKWQMLTVDGDKTAKEKVLTQGRLYNFQRGHTFYDTPAAYEGRWGEALRKIKYIVQVDKGEENVSFPKIEYEGGHYVRVNDIKYGMVEFTVYAPLAEEYGVETMAHYKCRQDEFVSLLQTGSFGDENGELIELW